MLHIHPELQQWYVSIPVQDQAHSSRRSSYCCFAGVESQRISMSMALPHDAAAFVLWLTIGLNFCQASEECHSCGSTSAHDLMSPMQQCCKSLQRPTLLKQGYEQTKLLLFLVFADILFNLDQPWHGQLDSANKGVDHVHVRHRFDEILFSNWSICLPRQQLDSLQTRQQIHGSRETQILRCMYSN